MFTSKSVYNKNNHVSKDGTAPIYIRLTYQRVTKYYHTNISIRPDQWKGEVINHPYSLELNSEIENLIFKAQSFYRSRRIEKKPFTLQLCNDYLGIDISESYTFTNFITTSIQEDKDNVAPSTYKKRKDVLKRLNGFQKVIYFSDLDYQFLQRFSKYLSKQDSLRGGKIGANYIDSIFTIFKKYVNEAVKQNLISVNPFFGFTINTTAKENVIHPESEIELIYTKVQPDHIEKTRLIYCFLLFTGLRYADIFLIRPKHFDDNMLKFVAGKTKKSKGKQARIPLALFQYRAKEIFDHFGESIPYLSNGTFNKNIKKLMNRLSIEKHVTAHTARHSFKSLMLERGYSLSYIAEMMAHSSIKTTESYGSISDAALLKERI